ncbi:hypothetical protein Tco_0424262 [Tanacetum coccineum]
MGKRKHNDESDPSQNNDGSCFRCGSSNHWAKSYRTAHHLCELYQASLKEKDGEVNLVDQVDFENNDLDTSDFLSGDTELNTQDFFTRVEIPNVKYDDKVTQESKARLKRGRPVGFKDKNPRKRKATENAIIHEDIVLEGT